MLIQLKLLKSRSICEQICKSAILISFHRHDKNQLRHIKCYHCWVYCSTTVLPCELFAISNNCCCTFRSMVHCIVVYYYLIAAHTLQKEQYSSYRVIFNWNARTSWSRSYYCWLLLSLASRRQLSIRCHWNILNHFVKNWSAKANGLNMKRK